MQIAIVIFLLLLSAWYLCYKIIVYIKGCRSKNGACSTCLQPCPLKNLKKQSQKFGKKEKSANFASENKKVP